MFLGRGNQKEGNGMRTNIARRFDINSIAAAALRSAAIVIVSLPGASWATTVHAPCTDTGQIGLRSCADYLINGTAAIPAPASSPTMGFPAIPSVFAQLTTATQNQINPAATNPGTTLQGYYQHVDPTWAPPASTLTPGAPPATLAQGTATQPSFGPTICNLNSGQFTPTAELTTNQVGESCGNPVNITINYSVTMCPPPASSCACSDPRPVPVVINKAYNASDPLNSPGLLEDGYMRGAIVQATTCFYKQVTNEITGPTHSLTVNNIDGSPSPCQSILDQYASLSSGLTNSIANLQTQLTGQANFADIVNCQTNWNATVSNQAQDVGPLRQSAQQLCSARTAIESMFVQLAACEIFARAQAGYVDMISSPASQTNILNMLQTQVATPCGNQCTAGAGWCSVPSASTVQTCANNCYKTNMPTAVQNFINGLWASDGSSCAL